MSSLAAAIVSYHPPAGLEARARLVAAAVERLYIVDNGSPGWPALAASLVDPRIDCIGLGENRGQAAALNVALERAAAAGLTHLLLLDQDSAVTTEFVDGLRAVWIESCSLPHVAVLAPVTRDAAAGRRRVPVGRDIGRGLREIDSAITSGSIVDVAFARRLGGFREELFIDWVDHEFCLRARAGGGRVLLASAVVLEHAVGSPRASGWRATTRHEPVRRYYQFRNRIWMLGHYRREIGPWNMVMEAGDAILALGRVLLLEDRRRANLGMALQGLRDAVVGRLGPYRRRES